MTTQFGVPHSQVGQKWPEQGEWGYEDWLRLPEDDFRYEVLDGELHVTPPPTVSHQNAVSSLTMWMRRHAMDNNLGLVLASPVGVRLPGQAVPVQPDVLFISEERKQIIGDDYIEGAPDLVVEVLSPSNWLYDRGKKQEAYRKAGVKEYWIVDYRAQTIEVLVLEEAVYVLQDQFELGDVARSAILPGFEVAVDDVFSTT